MLAVLKTTKISMTAKNAELSLFLRCNRIEMAVISWLLLQQIRAL
jgi:hypothetical protein